MIDRGKSSGLLLEMVETLGNKALVIGIGININNAPDISDYKTSKVSDYVEGDASPSPQGLLSVLDRCFFAKMDQLLRDGFSELRQEWLNHAFGIGETIIARLPDEEVNGIFEGIDEQGALILRNDLAIRRINSADVFFQQLAL